MQTLPEASWQWAEAMAIRYGTDVPTVVLATYKVGLYLSRVYERAVDGECPLPRAVLNDDRLKYRAGQLMQVIITYRHELVAYQSQVEFSKAFARSTVANKAMELPLSLPSIVSNYDGIQVPPTEHEIVLLDVPEVLQSGITNLARLRGVNYATMCLHLTLCMQWLDLNFPTTKLGTLEQDLMSKLQACDALSQSVSHHLSCLEAMAAHWPHLLTRIKRQIGMRIHGS